MLVWNALIFTPCLSFAGGGGFAVVLRGNYRGNIVAVKRIFDPTVTEAIRQVRNTIVEIICKLCELSTIHTHMYLSRLRPL